MKNTTHERILWIVRTGVLLALLVTLQYITKPAGQLLTGSCVNAVLAVAALFGGLSCGIVIALLSPVLAYLLNIAPQILTVPAIMVGNTVYVLLLALLYKESTVGKFFAWLAAAAAKAAVLYGIVAGLICGVFAPALLGAGMLKEPMLKALPATFSWMQLFTALIGGALAMLLVPPLKKALKK